MGNLVEHSHCCGYLSWTPRPVPITDNKDYIRVLLYSHYTTITGWGFLLTDRYPTISGLSLGNHPNPKLGTSIAAHGPSLPIFQLPVVVMVQGLPIVKQRTAAFLQLSSAPPPCLSQRFG